MTMIPISKFPYYLSLENYRAFRKCENIPIKPITLIYGENSSGKSSLVDAYLHFLKFNAQNDTSDAKHIFDRVSFPEHFKKYEKLGFRAHGIKPNEEPSLISVSHLAYDSKYFHGSEKLRTDYSVAFMDIELDDDLGHEQFSWKDISRTSITPDAFPRLRFDGGEFSTLKTTLGKNNILESLLTSFSSRMSNFHSYELFASEVLGIAPEKDAWKSLMAAIDSVRKSKKDLMKLSNSLSQVKPTKGRLITSGRRSDSPEFKLLKNALERGIRSTLTDYEEPPFPSMFIDEKRSYIDSDQVYNVIPNEESWYQSRIHDVETALHNEWVISKLGVDWANGWMRERGNSGFIYDLTLENIFKNDSKEVFGYRLGLFDKLRGAKRKFQEVGSGFTYIMPLVLASLSEAWGLVVCKQPELHLHPKMQCEIGDLLIEGMNFRARDPGDPHHEFVIETHSENILLRILRRIRETANGDLANDLMHVTPDDVSIIYVENKGELGSEAYEIPIDEDGNLMREWPKGFFEEGLDEVLA
jgi:predicted ATPase